MVLVLAKYGKISDVQATRSIVITILKRLFQLSGKVVTVIMKKLSQLSGKAVCFGQKPMKSDGCFQTAGEDIQHLLDGFG